MNELYKTITADFTSLAIFILMSGLFGFSSLILICSAVKTVLDYYFFQKLNYIKSLTSMQRLADFVNSEESTGEKKS